MAEVGLTEFGLGRHVMPPGLPMFGLRVRSSRLVWCWWGPSCSTLSSLRRHRPCLRSPPHALLFRPLSVASSTEREFLGIGATCTCCRGGGRFGGPELAQPGPAWPSVPLGPAVDHRIHRCNPWRRWHRLSTNPRLVRPISVSGCAQVPRGFALLYTAVPQRPNLKNALARPESESAHLAPR